jgi:small subunit ribosomal protein S4
MRGARQLIVHGHVAVDGKRVSSPSYLLKFSEENSVDWFGKPVAGGASSPVAAVKLKKREEAKEASKEEKAPKEEKKEENKSEEKKE